MVVLWDEMSAVLVVVMTAGLMVDLLDAMWAVGSVCLRVCRRAGYLAARKDIC